VRREEIPVLTRERLHHLIDLLPERELPVAERVLEALATEPDPFLRALAEAASREPEELTSEEEALEEGLADLAAGRVVPHEEARRLVDQS
jgi:predicted transcriptional regulator